MAGYSNAARNFNYPEFDDEDNVQASAPARASNRQQTTAYQPVTRQPNLPQPFKSSPEVRRTNTRPNLPVAVSQPVQAGTVRPSVSQRTSPGNASHNAIRRPAGTSNMKLLGIGIGLIALLVVSYLLVSFSIRTWQTWQDDLTYGRPRITRLEANVGHNEAGGNKTIFFAQNINGQISITEFPGSDPSKTRVIIGPNLFGKDKDLVPVRLQVRDVNNDGQNDLIALADEQQLIYINENGNFRPINDQERNKLKVIEKGDAR